MGEFKNLVKPKDRIVIEAHSNLPIHGRGHRLSKIDSNKEMVPEVGFEPTRGVSPAGF